VTLTLGLSEKTGNAIKRVEFMPRPGIWKDFLRFMRTAVVDYCKHRLHMLTFSQSWKLMEREPMHHPALRRAGYHGEYPVHAKGVAAIAVIDFSTSLDHVRLMTATCQYPERTHLCVLVLCHSPHMIRVVDLPEGQHKTNMLRKSFTTKLMYKTAVFYGYSKDRSSAMFQMNVMVDAMSILNKGLVGLNSNCECFEGCERLGGGSRGVAVRLPLKHGLTDRATPSPYATDPIQHVMRRRDNCGDQFNGAPAYKGVEEFKERTGADLTDVGSVAGEGKHVAGGYGAGPQDVLVKHAVSDESFSGDTFQDGTRNMVMFVASKLHTGTKKGKFTRGRWSVDHYFHLHYDEAFGFDRTMCPAAHTWKGSDSHTLYFTTDNRGLGRRYRLCWCLKCSNAKYSECVCCSVEAGMANYYGGCAAANYTYVRTKTAPRPRDNLRSQSDPIKMVRALRCLKDVHGDQGPKTLLRRVLAMRVDPKGHNPQNEQYFLVRPTKKPWVTKEQRHAGGNATPKGTPLFEGNYFVCGDLQEGTGHRAYALVTGLTSVVTLTLPAVVHDAGDISFDAKIQTADGQAQYLLHSDTHEHLMEKGSLTATT
jgi:hypothetical protein